MPELGQSLKAAREARKLTLDEIAQETRISTRFLQAIENEQFHVLPGGVFNRGFIRAYAILVGMDPEDAVAKYQAMAEPRDADFGLRPAGPDGRATERYLYGGAAAALALGIVIFYAVGREAPHVPPPMKAVLPEPQAAPPPAPNPVTAPVDLNEAAPAPTTITMQGRLAIELQIQEPTWVSIQVDGKDVIGSEILQPGDTRRFSAQEAVQLKLGNAGGVQIKLNDRAIPPLGRSGQVKSVLITPNNLKEFIGGN